MKEGIVLENKRSGKRVTIMSPEFTDEFGQLAYKCKIGEGSPHITLYKSDLTANYTEILEK